MRKKSDKQNGFTIIEVSLVLAVGGLIFLMVFVALPSMQRLARDSQRKEDVTQLMNSIKKFMTNNRQGLPTGSGTVEYTNGNVTSGTWRGFYKTYLGENFNDPSGTRYKLNVETLTESKKQYTYTSTAMDYTMHIEISARCDGEHAVKTENPRKIAIVYRLEGSGVFCDDM